MLALTGDYPLTAMMRRRPTRVSWVLSIRFALMAFEQWSTSVWWLLSTLEGLQQE